MPYRKIQYRQLFFDTAVELAVVLMASAGGQEEALRECFEEPGNRLGALMRTVQEIQTKFQESFASFSLSPSVV